MFTLVTILTYLTLLWHRSPKAITAAGIGLLAGLISMCRLSGFLVILIPVFWGIGDMSSLREKIRLLGRNYSHVLIVVVATLVAFLPQILYWKANTGHFIYNAYDDPQSGFDFTNPRFGYVLFGFRKGFYLYSMMMIFATIGFIQLFRENRRIFLSVLLFFLGQYISHCIIFITCQLWMEGFYRGPCYSCNSTGLFYQFRSFITGKY